MPQLKQTNLEKDMFFIIKLSIFYDKLMMLVVVGTLSARSRTRLAKGCVAATSPSSLLDIILVLFLYFLQVFFCAFSGTLLFVTLGELGAQR